MAQGRLDDRRVFLRDDPVELVRIVRLESLAEHVRQRGSRRRLLHLRLFAERNTGHARLDVLKTCVAGEEAKVLRRHVHHWHILLLETGHVVVLALLLLLCSLLRSI